MLVPTLAVVATWFVAAVVLLGCGYACRQVLTYLFRCRTEPRLQPADLWLGLAAVLTYLEVWSLAFPIGAKTLVAPCVVVAIAVAVRRPLPTFRRPTRSIRWGLVAAGASTGLAVMWLANQALGRPTSYDSGLYHFSIIEYASRYPAIPGLAVLHERLGAGDAHLLLVSLMGSGPWRDAGFHLANGLLVAMLLADIVWRLASRETPPFTRRVAQLLVPAIAIFAVSDPGEHLSSPSLDAPAFVLVAAGTLSLCHCLERFELGPAMAATAAFATVTATRPYFAPAMIVVGVLVAAVSQRPARTLGLVSVIPVGVLTGWAARQAILSGYPLFPLTVGALPVDWRVPRDVVDAANDFVRSWARAPRKSPSEVLGSWDWLPGWLRRVARDPNVLLPLVLSLFALARLRGSEVRRATTMAALAPLLLTLVIWFVAAPDPRFVYGPIALVPIVLLACRPLDRRVVIFCSALAVTAALLGDGWQPITQRGDGPLGSFDPPTPTVQPFRTRSGVTIQQPVGDDRCWRLELCTPDVTPGLELRGSDVASGFRAS